MPDASPTGRGIALIEKTLLRIFVDTLQKVRHRPAYELIVEHARQAGLAGATLLEGVEGFGQHGAVDKERRWNVSNKREALIELIDEPGKIAAFLALAEPLLADAVVTQERVRVVRR